jgi:spermidine synthase
VDLTYTDIDHESTPIGRLTLRAYRANTGESGHEILLDGAFLMASHGSHSERAMANLAHRRLPVGACRLSALVGGLGAGHTLRAALDLPGVERVEVVEIGR